MICFFPFLFSYFQDSTFEFERKRNRPERYDRNLAENTLKAIKKIDKVRVDREARHHALRFIIFASIIYQKLWDGFCLSQVLMNISGRMKGKKAKEQREAAKELEQSIHMVKAPAVLEKEPALTLPKIKVKVSQPQAEENHPMEE